MRGREEERKTQREIMAARHRNTAGGEIRDGKNKDQENIENRKRKTMNKERITNVDCVYSSNTIMFIGRI